MAEASKSTESRSAYLDNAKGVLIFLVVLGHFLWDYRDLGSSHDIVAFIYLFHMPAFALVAGFLSKSDHSRSLPALVHLAVLYVLMNTALMLVGVGWLDAPLALITPYYSSWFLLSLISWRLIIAHIASLRRAVQLTFAIALAIGWWSDVTNVLAVSRTIAFLPFFAIGYMLPSECMARFIENRKGSDRLKSIVLLLAAVFVSALLVRVNGGPDQADLLMDGYSSLADLLVRLAVFAVSGLVIISLALLMPSKPIPLVCRWGKNSLGIYVLHRFVTFAFASAFPMSVYSDKYIAYAAIASVVTVLVLGLDPVSRGLAAVATAIAHTLSAQRVRATGHRSREPRLLVVSITAAFLFLPVIVHAVRVANPTPHAGGAPRRVIHPVMSPEQAKAIQNSISLAFVGDLILLQDQVRRAYSPTTGAYEFGSMFEHASEYLRNADLAIGVLEGPLAGERAGYSTSNYGDGLPLSLNYPDSFARSVKEAGIDLVSTANNHLLDKGEAGVARTIDILDSVGLRHVGSYRSESEKRAPTIIEVDGVRFAFLAYTYGSNGYDETYFLTENPSVTSLLVAPNSRYFRQVKASVIEDLARVRAMEPPPDAVVVIPHMGTQFSHSTDSFQEVWNRVFVEAGADIILGDHAHAVQPVELREVADATGVTRRAMIVNCPGNFANSYVEHDGDATAIVEVYVDRRSKETIGAAIIPMYTQAYRNSYRALPIYSIIRNPALRGEVSGYEMERVAEVQSVVTSVMLGTELTLDQAQDRYYLFLQGHVRQPARPIQIDSSVRASPLYSMLAGSRQVLFVGDSITAGSENGGYGWYEPLMAAIPSSMARREAWPSATTVTLLENVGDILAHEADLYVIAIGTNDIRYRNEATCAMDASSYTENIDALLSAIRVKRPNAQFVLVSPWSAQPNDPYTRVPMELRRSLSEAYRQALETYCRERGFWFADPSPIIDRVLQRYPPSDYLIDHIHPNANTGIALYSEAFLTSGVR